MAYYPLPVSQLIYDAERNIIKELELKIPNSWEVKIFQVSGRDAYGHYTMHAREIELECRVIYKGINHQHSRSVELTNRIRIDNTMRDHDDVDRVIDIVKENFLYEILQYIREAKGYIICGDDYASRRSVQYGAGLVGAICHDYLLGSKLFGEAEYV